MNLFIGRDAIRAELRVGQLQRVADFRVVATEADSNAVQS